MTHITCMLTAKNRDQLRNPTLGNRVWATFTFFTYGRGAVLVVLRGAGRRGELMSVTAGYHFNMQTNLEIRQEQCCTVGIQLFKLRANKMIQNLNSVFSSSQSVLDNCCTAAVPLRRSILPRPLYKLSFWTPMEVYKISGPIYKISYDNLTIILLLR